MMVRGYFIIPPLFFYLLGGIIFILRFSKTPLDKPANIVNVYMLMRMIKIFVSFAVILIYWMVHKENIRNFAIIFIFFYIINLIWETYIYLRMEKYIKYKKDQKNHQENESINETEDKYPIYPTGSYYYLSHAILCSSKG